MNLNEIEVDLLFDVPSVIHLQVVVIHITDVKNIKNAHIVDTIESIANEEEEVERNTDQTAPTEVIVKKVAQVVTKVAKINQLKSKLKHLLSKLNQKDNSYHHRVEFICHHSK